MWSEAQLCEHLRESGLREGRAILAHTSLRAIGPIEGGAEALIRAFRQVLGPTGTLLVPTFTFGNTDPAQWRNPPTDPTELERLRREAFLFDPATTPAHTDWMGIFPEIVRQQPDAHRSSHPNVSFTAIGEQAVFLTVNAPFHYPLGSDSPLARLHQMDGYVFLMGVDHTVNTSLHLAEIWANVPYIHRTSTVKTGPETWTTMQGSPECSAGFGKIEPLLRQSRMIRAGQLGNAPTQLIRQQHLISLAITLLQGDNAALLCENPDCPWCRVARKYVAKATPLEEEAEDGL